MSNNKDNQQWVSVEPEFPKVVFIIKSEIADQVRRRALWHRELKKEFPYKCRTKTDAKRAKIRYRKMIKEINSTLKEYRNAITHLQPKNHETKQRSATGK